MAQRPPRKDKGQESGSPKEGGRSGVVSRGVRLWGDFIYIAKHRVSFFMPHRKTTSLGE